MDNIMEDKHSMEIKYELIVSQMDHLKNITNPTHVLEQYYRYYTTRD